MSFHVPKNGSGAFEGVISLLLSERAEYVTLRRGMQASCELRNRKTRARQF